MREAIKVLAEHLATAGTPEATTARDRPLPRSESAGTSAAQVLADRSAQDGDATVARLTAAAAAPDPIERAKTAAAKEVAHALQAAQTAKRQPNDINGLIQQAVQEAERRVGLTPQQRQTEQATRRQHAARQ
ncbi:hypothetical protein ACFOOM_22375 [Streptomyces echinoruber]|uniref:Uncharacterized protein n=1 Tax=Streptomyces echinoruber TaxID=68898 RepID=A0A918V8T8_9ACTN|nr:hypothetical protein [Streptomyces echinoruber]GGZ82197.1 hypothetical protein GCM10010389_20170 [Streptomyces echinoruber]